MKTIISLCAAMYYKKPARKPAGKSRNATLKAKLDRVFSEYIRLRDTAGHSKEGYFRCISCGQIKPYSQADCGHYIGRQHMATRYNEINCNAQCRFCNRFNEGMKGGYRQGLVKKYGEDKVLLLEASQRNTAKISDFEYEELIKFYQQKIKEF
jgi:hypothetical protein